MVELIEKFYSAFAELDAQKMCECYHDEIVFEDPAFGQLKGQRAGNMWRMLCKSQQGKGFRIVYSGITGNDKQAKAHWEAFYTFSKTGRKVHNRIEAYFEFKDNKIVLHKDQFDLHLWAKQALGWKGALLGNTAFFKKNLQRQTNRLLDRFENQ